MNPHLNLCTARTVCSDPVIRPESVNLLPEWKAEKNWIDQQRDAFSKPVKVRLIIEYWPKLVYRPTLTGGVKITSMFALCKLKGLFSCISLLSNETNDKDVQCFKSCKSLTLAGSSAKPVKVRLIIEYWPKLIYRPTLTGGVKITSMFALCKFKGLFSCIRLLSNETNDKDVQCFKSCQSLTLAGSSASRIPRLIALSLPALPVSVCRSGYRSIKTGSYNDIYLPNRLNTVCYYICVIW